MSSAARQIAEAVLSGRPVECSHGYVSPRITPYQPVSTHVDPGRREFKLCEWCPRTFTRAIWEQDRYCAQCRTRRRVPGTRTQTQFSGRSRRDRKAVAANRLSMLLGERTRVVVAGGVS
jgi:hypothetical protein